MRQNAWNKDIVTGKNNFNKKRDGHRKVKTIK